MVEEARKPHPLTSAKDEILKRIRTALGNRNGHRESDYAYVSRHYQVPGKRDVAGKLELFADRLQDYGSTVFECTEEHISQAISEALHERGLWRILTASNFEGGWIPAGFDFGVDYELTYDEIDAYEGVITRCALAIAETGTIVLRHADDEPRRAVTLIPDYHLCIVFAEQVVETVPEGVRRMAEMGDVPLTTISGPSATSDIEMTRIIGVHGPRTLDVVVVTR